MSTTKNQGVVGGEAQWGLHERQNSPGLNVLESTSTTVASISRYDSFALTPTPPLLLSNDHIHFRLLDEAAITRIEGPRSQESRLEARGEDDRGPYRRSG